MKVRLRSSCHPFRTCWERRLRGRCQAPVLFPVRQPLGAQQGFWGRPIGKKTERQRTVILAIQIRESLLPVRRCPWPRGGLAEEGGLCFYGCFSLCCAWN